MGRIRLNAVSMRSAGPPDCLVRRLCPVPQWIATDWPFTRPRYIGRDLSWADWLAWPDVDPPGGG
jgi:hypothetical protein